VSFNTWNIEFSHGFLTEFKTTLTEVLVPTSTQVGQHFQLFRPKNLPGHMNSEMILEYVGDVEMKMMNLQFISTYINLQLITCIWKAAECRNNQGNSEQDQQK